jgi:hypothetical protein
MSRVLVVTQAARALGEFRRPWVRAGYRRFVIRHQRAVARVCARLGPHVELTLLTSRELVDPGALPVGTAVRYYEDEAHKLDAERLSKFTATLAENWWPSRSATPELEHRGVWLPDVIAMRCAIVIRLEITQLFGAVERVLQEVEPARLVVMTGASIPERLTRTLAQAHHLAIEVSTPRFVSARLYAAVARAVLRRDEKRRVREFADHPRRPLSAPLSAHPFLFVTARPRHHYVVDPLNEAVRAIGVPTSVLVAPDPDLTPRVDALVKSGTPAGFLSDYVSPAEAGRLIRLHRPRFRRLWRRLSSAPTFRSALTWEGIAFDAVARPFLRDAVEVSLLTALLCQEAASRAIEALAPRALVLTANRRMTERSLSLAARAAGIPSLVFSNTLLMERDVVPMLDTADRLLVIGDHLRDRLIRERGMLPEQVTVLGDIRSNAARLASRDDLRADISSKFNLKPGRALAVLVSKYVSTLFSSDEKERLYRLVREAMAQLPAVDVIVKVHPNEDLALLHRQAREWGWPVEVFTQTYDIHRLFAAADATIMVTSMAGVEAMAMDCPVIAVQPVCKDFETESGSMPRYVKEGAIELVSLDDPGAATALAVTLRRLIDDRAAREHLVERGRRFAVQYIRPVDGRLAHRLLAIADEARLALEAQRG